LYIEVLLSYSLKMASRRPKYVAAMFLQLIIFHIIKLCWTIKLCISIKAVTANITNTQIRKQFKYGKKVQILISGVAHAALTYLQHLMVLVI